MRLPILSLVPGAAFLLFTGCSTLHLKHAQLKSVRLSASPEMVAAGVRVDAALATPELEAVTTHDYWQPGNPVRAAAKYQTVHFGPGRAPEQVLNNDGWGKKVLIIADLPGQHCDSETKLELAAKGKGAKSTALVKVSPAGLRLEPLR